ncbi:MAG: GNAT family acetyltransferase [Cyanobium sp.]|nr:MAG: GNAT family acetyltransferase [Cyanobium sp.]
MIPFRSQPASPRLPEGYTLSSEDLPSPAELNQLLMSCGEQGRKPERLRLGLERSAWHFSVRDRSGTLVGFVRATSDQALNANLWDLAASPTDQEQAILFSVLVQKALARLRKELSGCSVSVAAPPAALQALQHHGFLVDPGGIRAMGLSLEAPVLSKGETSMEGFEPPTLRTGI